MPQMIKPKKATIPTTAMLRAKKNLKKISKMRNPKKLPNKPKTPRKRKRSTEKMPPRNSIRITIASNAPIVASLLDLLN